MALAGPCTAAVARVVAEGPQADVIVAPAFEPEAVDILVARRKATRLLEAPAYRGAALEVRSLGGGYLVQDADRFETTRSDWQVATKAVPTAEQWRDVELAWRVCARTSSNAIVIVADGQAVGIGAGQQSRVEAAEIAVRKAGPAAVGAVAASDAFFPFRDGLDVLAAAGVAVGGPARRLGPRRRRGGGGRRTGHGHGPHLRATLPALSRPDGRHAGHHPERRGRGRPHPGRGGRSRGPTGRAGIRPGLGTILVGDDAPSARYVAMKHEDCAEVGIVSVHEHLPADVSQDELEAVIARFNADPAVHAYLVQIPLPAGLDEEAALLAVDPAKDVDGLHPRTWAAWSWARPGPLPCTPAGIVELLAAYEVPVEGRHVVVIGRGLTIGRPLALLLTLKRPGCNAAVTVVHTGVADLAGLVRTGDVVVAAAGAAGLVTPDMVRPGAAVVGAGTSWEGRKLLSDVDEAVAEVAGWITPRIGGVGPMTRAMLLRNTVRAASRAAGPGAGGPGPQ